MNIPTNRQEALLNDKVCHDHAVVGGVVLHVVVGDEVGRGQEGGGGEHVVHAGAEAAGAHLGAPGQDGEGLGEGIAVAEAAGLDLEKAIAILDNALVVQ